MLTSLERYAPWAIAAFRVVVGFLFFCHGATTLLSWPAESHGGAPSFGAWPSWWSGAIELVGGLLLILGLGTRLAAFIGSGAMAVAYFWKHQGDGLFPVENGGDSAALYCWALLLLVFIGPGKLALDSVIGREPTPDRSAAPADRPLEKSSK
ncbi:DoxX family protein [Gordonia sp. CPCC 205333]|uniref:DoxX family protein n=1 Tax=Gordonia sp. CPCC 205333 TaxID=3140790 RepID=UPI003AF3DE82